MSLLVAPERSAFNHRIYVRKNFCTTLNVIHVETLRVNCAGMLQQNLTRNSIE